MPSDEDGSKPVSAASDETSAPSTNIVGKAHWTRPMIVSVAPITDTAGLGGGGPDFGSELS